LGICTSIYEKEEKLENPKSHEILSDYQELGKKYFEEKVLLKVFVAQAVLWFFMADIVVGSFRIPDWSNIFNESQFFNDGTVAIFIAVFLLILPSKVQPGTFLMDWKAAEEIPWEIILLFGGGFALTSGF